MTGPSANATFGWINVKLPVRLLPVSGTLTKAESDIAVSTIVICCDVSLHHVDDLDKRKVASGSVKIANWKMAHDS